MATHHLFKNGNMGKLKCVLNVFLMYLIKQLATEETHLRFGPVSVYSFHWWLSRTPRKSYESQKPDHHRGRKAPELERFQISSEKKALSNVI